MTLLETKTLVSPKDLPKPKAKKFPRTLVEGIPGVGNIGQFTVQTIIQQYNPTKVAIILSDSLPFQVVSDEKGVLRLMEVALYYLEPYDLFLLTADDHPQTPVGFKQVTDAIIKLVKSYGIEQILTLGGRVTGALHKQPNSYLHKFSEKDNPLLSALIQKGVLLPSTDPKREQWITGVTGVLIPKAIEESIPVATVLTETHGLMPDPNAARFTLQILEKTFGFTVDYALLLQQEQLLLQQIRSLQAQERGEEDFGRSSLPPTPKDSQDIL
ncbi:MAG: PAC2 family protein [Candidatus Ranarchaeia archaeon]|jgi:proteasome assembly chaperone (PAC2) family protein